MKLIMEIMPPRDASSGVVPAPTEPAPPPNSSPFGAGEPILPPAEQPNRLRPILSFAGLLFTAFAIAFILNTFVIQSYQVDGQSMETTLQNNDRLIVSKVPRTWSHITGHQYVPKRGQIIIFNESDLPGFVGTKQLIKRVIGLPGERVVYNNGHYTVYNSSNPDGFNPDNAGIYSERPGSPPSDLQVDVTLQNNQLFVGGDNRGNSEDSRYFGPIQTDQVVAKLVLRVLPLNKANHY